MYYLVSIKTLSNDSVTQSIDKYDNKDTCLRKFHENFNVIGGGPKRITSIMLEDTVIDPNVLEPDGSVVNPTTMVVKNETWVAPVTETE